MRVDRLLANLGYGSRKEVDQLLRRGRVTLDGNILSKGETKVELKDELRTRLLIDGEGLDPLPGLNLLMNKPIGFSCSHKEEGELVYDLLPVRWQKRQPALSTVGRLDKDTSGILLITDDGTLLHKITSPKKHIQKTYFVNLARPLAGTEAAIFSSGKLKLEGDEKPLLAATLTVVSPLEARLSIQEGRYHQVRRMFAAIGNHVEKLHREKIGNLSLPKELAQGKYKILTEEELLFIFK